MESNIFSTSGRITRSTFWSRALQILFINLILVIIMTFDLNYKSICSGLILFNSFFLMIQSVKRKHDVNKSGWYIFIPIYGFILNFIDGTQGQNNYGNNPKEIKRSINQENTKEIKKENLITKDIYNSFFTILISLLISISIYTLINVSNLITNEKITNSITIFLFSICNIYFLSKSSKDKR